eukprot:4246407-Ditylum_brightwellii.AAC.1
MLDAAASEVSGLGIYLLIWYVASFRLSLMWKSDRKTSHPDTSFPEIPFILLQCAICCNFLNEPLIEYQANPLPTNDNGPSIVFRNCGAY